MLRPNIKYNDPHLTVNSRFFAAAAVRSASLHTKMTVQARREELNRLGKLYKPPEHVICLQEIVGGVPCEWAVPRRRFPTGGAVLYIHGGSWSFGSLDSGRAFSVLLAERLRLPVLSVNYRLCPEHPYPCALEDCYSVWRAATGAEGFAPDKVALVGDSAGGNLCLCLVQKLKLLGEALPAGVFCASPVTDLRPTSSLQSHRPPVLYQTGEDGEPVNIVEQYLQGKDPRDPLVSPIFGHWEDTPPILIHTGEAEALRDDSILFARVAGKRGGDVLVKLWYGMFHDFTLIGPFLAESRESLQDLALFLHYCLRQDEASS